MVSVTIDNVTYTNIKSLTVDNDMIIIDLNDKQLILTSCKDVVEVAIENWGGDD